MSVYVTPCAKCRRVRRNGCSMDGANRVPKRRTKECADCRYGVRIDLDADAKGARRRRFVGVYRTAKEAEMAERDALSLRDKGIELGPRTVTVQNLLARFIADCRRLNRA